MEIISWNVNGIRACIKNGFIEWVKDKDPDILCIQETKANPKQVSFTFDLPNYTVHWHSAQKKGYSGVATFTKQKPLSISTKIGHNEFDSEGRCLLLEFEMFYLINLYFPNAQRGLKRLDFKLAFNDILLENIEKLRKRKNIVLCGDFNVAHKEIDLRNPQANQNNAGFSRPEREWFSKLLDQKYIDTFRFFHPGEEGAYSWWTYRYQARDKNIGWRVDYFVVNEEMQDKLEDAYILSEVLGSDHAPVGIKVKI